MVVRYMERIFQPEMGFSVQVTLTLEWLSGDEF